MSEFTKGEWEIISRDFAGRPYIGVRETDVDICEVFDDGKEYNQPEPEEAEANARLIAAAPKLLARCQEALKVERVYFKFLKLHGLVSSLGDGTYKLISDWYADTEAAIAEVKKQK